jgi:hypothetical protein
MKPEAQGVHTVLATPVAYSPARQAVQMPAPSAEMKPAAHWVHTE